MKHPLLWLASGLLTFAIIYLILRTVTFDYAYAMIPGWHTTILPPNMNTFALTTLTIVVSLFIFLIFRLLLWVLKR